MRPINLILTAVRARPGSRDRDSIRTASSALDKKLLNDLFELFFIPVDFFSIECSDRFICEPLRLTG
jgi:hypothetical protein